MSFKQHFDMISMHEPITRKAKFWQSYVRALKGTDDMRAGDSSYNTPRGARARSEFPEFFAKSIADEYSPYSDSSAPSHRIFAPGYRYLPISRETYGYSPRPIYGYDRPSRYERPRAASVPPMNSSLTDPWFDTPRSYYPRAWTREPSMFREPSMARDLSRARSPSMAREMSRARSPTPALAGRGYRNLYDMMNPDPYMPISRFTRAPWWYDLASPLIPMTYYPRRVLTYPSSLRSSYLSPVRNSYLWSRHPLRQL